MTERRSYWDTAIQPDNPEPPSTPAGEHTHRQPRQSRFVVIMLVGLTVLLILITVLVVAYAYTVNRNQAATERRLQTLERVVTDRSQMRDQQYLTLDERIDRAFCEVFDELPAGGLLDTARAEHGCGPGVPLADLSPDQLNNLQRYADGLPLSTDNSPADPAHDYNATPDPSIPAGPTVDRKKPREPAESPPAAPTTSAAPVAPTTAPSPSPLVDLGPVTVRVCEATGVCA